MHSDSATDDYGHWRIDRRLLATGSVVLGVMVLAIWPIDVVPPFVQDDALLHFTSGFALTLMFAAAVPGRDDVIAVSVAAAGVLWEPVEWYYFKCWAADLCTDATLVTWMTGSDTWKDMALVALGAVVALIVIGRYE